MLAAIW